MSDYRNRFLQLAVQANALGFGEFTLKSGRISPYFFNAGRFQSGAQLAQLARSYADAIAAAGLAFDVVFGPAYKGIPLATAVVCELAQRGQDVPVAFNRKEAKSHGEGGQLIGADLNGKRVLIIDDVITAGTAIREAVQMIDAAGGQCCAIVIALDRQERISEDKPESAAQAVSAQLQVPVVAIAGFTDLLDFVAQQTHLQAQLPQMQAYRQRYGV